MITRHTYNHFEWIEDVIMEQLYDWRRTHRKAPNVGVSMPNLYAVWKRMGQPRVEDGVDDEPVNVRVFTFAGVIKMYYDATCTDDEFVVESVDADQK